MRSFWHSFLSSSNFGNFFRNLKNFELSNLFFWPILCWNSTASETKSHYEEVKDYRCHLNRGWTCISKLVNGTLLLHIWFCSEYQETWGLTFRYTMLAWIKLEISSSWKYRLVGNVIVWKYEARKILLKLGSTDWKF